MNIYSDCMMMLIAGIAPKAEYIILPGGRYFPGKGEEIALRREHNVDDPQGHRYFMIHTKGNREIARFNFYNLVGVVWKVKDE